MRISAGQHHGVGPVRAETEEQRVGGDADRHAAEHDRCVAVAAHEARRQRRCDDRVDPGDHQRQAGGQRRPATQLLEVQHCDELEADERPDEQQGAEVGPHQRASNAGCRAAPAALSSAVRCTTNTARRSSPPASVATVCSQATSGSRTRARTSRSMPDVRLTAPPRSKPPRRSTRRVVVGQVSHGEDEQSECAQHRGEEHPTPVDRGEQPTGDHAEREAACCGAAVHQQRPVAGAHLRRSWS